MSGILNSGKLATLLTRLSATRAGYLDNLVNADSLLSTLLSDGGYTAARAAKLDNLDAAVSSATASVPVSLAGALSTVQQTSLNSTATGGVPASGATSCGGSINVYTNLWNVSGDGFIFWLTLFATEALTQNYQFKFVIDGSTVFESASNYWASGDGNGDGKKIITNDSGVVTPLRFTTSFQVAVRCTSANSAKNFNSYCGYYTIA